MKIQIVKNKYVNALFLLMLGSAAVHMLILFYLAIKSGSIYVLNYFNILDFDLFYPNLFNSTLGNIFSAFFILLVYLIILQANKNK